MIPKNEVKFFKRFIKEKGLYFPFLRDSRYSARNFGKTRVKDVIENYSSGGSVMILMECVLWSTAYYRNWQEMYSEYKTYFDDNFTND